MSALAAVMLVLLSVSPDSMDAGLMPEGWTMGWKCLVSATGNGRWAGHHPVIDSTDVDAALSVMAESQEVDFLVTGALKNDSADTFVFRRARAEVKWPGTPWVGAGLYLHDRQPFIPGLSNPLVEWGWVDIDSLHGYGFSIGGILGFNGEYSIQQTGADTLTQLNIKSPWMGFAGFAYSRVQYHSAESPLDDNIVLNALLIRSDFRYFKPWVVIAGAEGEKGRWAVTGEIRDFRTFTTDLGEIEVVPAIAFAGEEFSAPGDAFVPGQRLLKLGAYLRSVRYIAGAGIIGMLDLESDSLSGVSVIASMVSEASVTWDMEFDAYADGDYRAAFGAGTADSFSSAGMRMEILEDSTRLTGMASCTPREDVSAELTVSADVDGSLDPACRLDISTALGPVSGLIGIHWEQGSDVTLSINLRGLLQ